MSIPTVVGVPLAKPSDPGAIAVLNAAQAGCYGLELTLDAGELGLETRFAGTLRFETIDETTTHVRCRLSADLYAGAAPAWRAGVVPVSPRANYRAYVSVYRNTDTAFGLRFVGDELQASVRRTLLSGSAWASGSPLRLALRLSASGSAHTFDVEVRKGATAIGTGRATWLTTVFRGLTVLPASADATTVPTGDGNGASWQSLFLDAGWQLSFQPTAMVTHPGGLSVWTLAELNAALSQLSSGAPSLDDAWYVHLLCVKQIEAGGGSIRGVMFDFDTADDNHTPRQGSAVAGDWQIPNDAAWRAGMRTRFAQFPSLYFRTSVHEVGHALGMQHSDAPSERSVMTVTTDLLGRPGFPDGLAIETSEAERTWLRHQPDPIVRPGGLPYPATLSLLDAGDLRRVRKRRLILDVAPLLDEYPFGAAVRLQLKLSNRGRSRVKVPHAVGFSTGRLEIVVGRPDGTMCEITSDVIYCEEAAWVELPPGRSIEGAVTLLRIRDETVFPEPGRYEVVVRMPCCRGRTRRFVSGRAFVDVRPPATDRERTLADRVNRSADLQRLLLLGEGGGRAGNRLMNRVLASNTLRPHFEFIEAKRLGVRYFQRKPDLAAMAKHLHAKTVMTHQEVGRTIDIIQRALSEGSRAHASASKMQQTLVAKVHLIPMSATTRTRLRKRLRYLADFLSNRTYGRRSK